MLGYTEEQLESIRNAVAEEMMLDLRDSVQKGRDLDVRDGSGATAVSIIIPCFEDCTLNTKHIIVSG